jgi:hypothetical protein
MYVRNAHSFICIKWKAGAGGVGGHALLCAIKTMAQLPQMLMAASYLITEDQFVRNHSTSLSNQPFEAVVRSSHLFKIGQL